MPFVDIKPAPTLSSCVNFATAGSKVFVGKIWRCEDIEPLFWTLDYDAISGTPGAPVTTAKFFITAANRTANTGFGFPTTDNVVIQKGKVLTLGGTKVTLAANLVIPPTALLTASGVTVAVSPVTTSIAAGSTTVMDAPSILSVTQSGITDSPTNIDTTNQSSGTRFAETYIGATRQLNVGVDHTKGDRAVSVIMQEALDRASLVFVALVGSGGFLCYGTAYVSRGGVTRPNKEITRMTYNFLLQPDVVEIPDYSLEPAANQTVIQTLTRQLGAPIV